MAVSIRKSKHRGPLSATVFLRRNVAKTAPLTLVIILAVMLIAGIVAMMNSIPLSIRTIYGYMKLHTGITGRSNPLLIPRIKEQVLTETPVPLERLITCRVTDGRIQSIVGKWPFAVLALNPEDTGYYLKRMEMTSLTGRLPEGDKPEAVISEPVARSLEKGIGDSLLSPSSDDMYSANEVKIVGIAKTSNYVMLIPLAYHQKWHFPPIDVYLAFAKTPADQATLDKWALKKFTKEGGRVFSYADVSSDSEEMFKILYKVLNIVIGVLVVVITIMMAMLMNIYQSQRVQEFGLLQALGYTKKQLINRIVVESLLVIVGGWVLGCIAAYLMLTTVDLVVMHPRAFAIDRLDPMAYKYTVPVPIAIMATAIYTIMHRLRKFDPVGVVERRLV